MRNHVPLVALLALLRYDPLQYPYFGGKAAINLENNINIDKLS